MAQRVTVQEWAAKGTHPELGEIFGAIAKAATQIAKKIRLAGLSDTYGAAGATNVQGEQQQKLDVLANDWMIEALRACTSVVGLVSEEDDEPLVFPERVNSSGSKFVLSFDPLDGSSNIDVNVNVGTIFGVRAEQGSSDVKATVLRPGAEQVAAGYVVYGPSVVFVATVGAGVSGFTLDDSGEFVQSTETMTMPEQGPYYSTNEANAASWPEAYRAYVAMLVKGELGGKAYGARYIGSLVADFHRTLLKGGVFLYPPTEKAAKGKLRLQYEANPLAMIAEKSGGAAVNGAERILELVGTGPHDRTPLVIGSKREVEALQALVRGA
jgi:fructose-1,6-bisphosphatase I